MIERDERDWKRVDVVAPTLVQFMWPSEGKTLVHGIATDIGPGGIFVSTDTDADIDDLVSLDVDLVELGDHIIESGRVVRSEAGGFAVEFLYRCERLDQVRPC